MRNTIVLVKKVIELLSEVERYSFYKENLGRSLDRLFASYQEGKLTYFQYSEAQKKILKGKSRQEWSNYYNAYVLSLVKRIEAYNSQIFYDTYNDSAYTRIGAVAPAPKHIPKPIPEVVEPPAPSEEMIAGKPVVVVQAVKKPAEAAPAAAPEAAIEAPAPFVVEAEEVAVPVSSKEAKVERKLIEVRPSLTGRISLFFRRLFAHSPAGAKVGKVVVKPVAGPVERTVPAAVHAVKHVVPERQVKDAPMPKPAKPVLKAKKSWLSIFFGEPKPATSVFAKKTVAAPKPASPSAVDFSKIAGIGHFIRMVERSRKVEFTDKKSGIPVSTIQLETLRRKAKPEISAQIEKITATSLTKEARRIRDIMERSRSLSIYQPSFFGSVANIAIKKISLFLLDQFPDFFKDLYHALRLSNIKVLSNTYVNMMVLGILSSTLLGLFIFGLFFSVTELPVSQIIFRTLMMSVLAGLAAFAGFYQYPFSKMKQRRRSINTNLPFAINHMAAVSSSGVAPVRMFKLISESKEYGEVSVEIEKIVNYVEVFGYDILTALKAVASTSPSPQFKDFLEGMVSNTQTGGDLKNYFAQKAEEAMLNYQMERQKYVEAVSTYSDIYTGILIAAPLFFVASLSLVSLLGGKVGGVGVNVVIVIGTYVVIPFMNIGFMTFLEISQPEI
jgi:flagellar protein FlaJ